MIVVRVFTTDESFVDFPFSNAEIAGKAISSMVNQARANAQLIEVSADGEVAGAIPLCKIRFIRLVPVDDPIISFPGVKSFDGTGDEVELPEKANNER